MADALSIALSGLRAQGTRLAASSNNIANATTAGALPTPESPASAVYRPLNVSFVALNSGGGVSAQVNEETNGFTAIYDPSSIYANNEGFIAAPNVDINKEIINIMESKILFKANLATVKSEKEMLGELIDAIT